MGQQVVERELAPLLIELVDLALTAKQAHWNVSGMWFRQLHTQLDDLADDVRLWSDDVAERLSEVIGNNRSRIEKLGAVDLVSQDLVIGITGGLQKQEWMFAAEQPGHHP